MASKLGTKIITFGEVGPTDVLEFSVDFLGEPGDIHYINNGCSCTKAWYDGEENVIKGSVDLSLVQTSEGSNSVNKVVTVFLADGEDEFVADEQLKRIPNIKKQKERITIACTVSK